MNASIQYTDKGIVSIDSRTNKAESIAYLACSTPVDAVKNLRKELDQKPNATVGALSLLVVVMQDETMQAYAGQTAHHTKIDATFMNRMREVEDRVIKGFFFDSLPASMKTTEREVAWDTFRTGLRQPGSYQTVRGHVVKLFAHLGKLPCAYVNDKPQTDKLLSVPAMQKIYNADKAAVANPHADDNTLPNKLVKLSGEIDKNEKEFTSLSTEDLEKAIAAAKAVVLKLEARYTELKAPAAQDASESAAKAVSKAKAEPALV